MKRLNALLVCLACTFSLSAGEHYVRNPVKELGISDIDSREDRTFPLNVSYFIDGSASIECADLDDSDFIPAGPRFNPGFYKGVLWLDVFFLDDDADTEEFYLYFGNEHVDAAEVYAPAPGGWTFIGRTGRSIRRRQMSTPSWELFVPINEAELPRTSFHRIRIRMVSCFGAPLDLTLFSKRQFQNFGMVYSTLNFTIAGVCILIVLILFAFAVLFRDYIYELLACSSFFMFMLILQLKGIGPVYLWNAFACMDSSARFVYPLTSFFFILLACTAAGIIKESNPISGLKFSVPCIIILNSVGFLCSLIISSPAAVFVIFSTCMIVSCLILAAMCLIFSRKGRSETFYILEFFIPVTLIFALMQSFYLIRTLIKGESLFTLGNAAYYCYDFCFLMTTVPAVYLMSRRFGGRYMRMKKALDVYRKKEEFFNGERELFIAMTNQLLTLSELVNNAVELPQMKSESEAVKEIHGIIERSSVQMIDYLNAMLIFGTRAVPDSCPILISPFFESCVDVIRSPADRKGINLSFSNSVGNECVVRANRRLLELVFTNFMLTSVRCGASGRNISFSLSRKKDSFFLDARFNADPGCEKYVDSIIPQGRTGGPRQEEAEKPGGIGYGMVMRAVQIYGGNLSASRTGSAYRISVSMKFPVADGSGKGGLLNMQTMFESEIQKKLNNSGKTVPVTDSLFSAAGKTPVILLVEENVVARRFWEDILNGQCVTRTATTGVEAWNYLHRPDSPRPDIIFCSYNLPVMSGRELFMKCCDDENTRDIPFVFLLSPGDGDRKNELVRRGAVDCLVHPYSRSEVYRVIYAVLSISSKIQHSILQQIDRVVRGEMNSSPRQEYMPVQTKAVVSMTLTGAQTSIFHDAGLSSREQQIALLIIHGKSDKEIADSLSISPSTVASHDKKIFKKLNVHSRVELMDKLR